MFTFFFFSSYLHCRWADIEELEKDKMRQYSPPWRIGGAGLCCGTAVVWEIEPGSLEPLDWVAGCVDPDYWAPHL